MSRADVKVELRRLALRHTWTTTMSSSAHRKTVHVRYTRDGLTGHGEGAPVLRYGTSPESAHAALVAVSPILAESDPWHLRAVLGQLRDTLGPGQTAALSAVDMALHDWIAQRLKVPLFRYFGLDPEAAPQTSFSLGIDTPEITREKTREAAPYPILKVKVGLESDQETIAVIREVAPNKRIRVDANEGWTDPELAIRRINWLESQGVEMVEQPMPAAMLPEMRYVRSRVRLPLYADEACTSALSIVDLRDVYDGVNVKLDKAGGLLEASRWIAVARAIEMKVMLGCMVSSSCAITAAAHLAPLADVCDLDGNLLVQNDPFLGVTVNDGRLLLSGAAGLGLIDGDVDDRS